MREGETKPEASGEQASLLDDWAHPPRETPPAEEDGLVVDLDGFEGPLDLLLTLARNQKVDLAKISILDLVDQYLAFVDRVRDKRLELAADHLVMAAWLTYLKSRLLLPKPPQDDEPSGEELAAQLAFRLRRLEAMRDRAAALMTRPRVGRDVFLRGRPEPTRTVTWPKWEASLYDLLSAYADFRQRTFVGEVRVGGRVVWSLVDAREILERLVGPVGDWVSLDRLIAPHLAPETRATLIASTFAASLEMVREGRLELAQTGAFAPLMIRPREDAPEPGQGAPEGEEDT
ncbi:MAG: segregation/condensation protein A [Phyllobacteriaceae bacterium]|nr:segregation/condensation protein A [Phyllobacteriaceae bacterium]